MPGTLYLIPTSLSSDAFASTTVPRVREIIARLNVFVVEQPKTARRFLSGFTLAKPLAELCWLVLDEHTPSAAIQDLLNPLLAGNDVGLLSEAGCPAVADPGAALVRAAHASGIAVVPLVGPSSILLGLMASGLNGQRFRFHGYLPIRRDQRALAIRLLEQDSRRLKETQIFIETPYRNLQIFADLVSNCASSTLLCIATDLTSATEHIELHSMMEWKKRQPDILRRPSVFLLAANQAC